MKTRMLTLLALCATLSIPLSAQEYLPAFDTFTLPNGLKVILHHDSTVSFVSLHMSYRAGSSRDPKGKTGTANIAGELLLTGTRAFPREELIRLRTVENVSIRAQTSVDWFTVASVFPAEMLDLALKVEGDRLANAETALSVEVFDAIKAALQREHDRREKQPLASLTQQIFDELYGKDHPYRHATIGTSEDLKNIKLDDVREFIKRYYSASNGSLTISGNFQDLRVRALVKQYFEDIPAGVVSRWKSLTEDFHTYGQAAFIREDRIEANQLHLIFPSVPYGHDDDAVLKVLAGLLNGSKHGVLQEAIVNANPSVVSADVYQSSQEISGNFWITITVKPEMKLEVLYSQIMQLLGSLADEGVTEEEVLAARNQSAMRFYTPLEVVYGFGGRGDLLNLGMLYKENPLLSFDLFQREQSVTSVQLRAAVKRYLNAENQLIVSCVPLGKSAFAVTP